MGIQAIFFISCFFFGCTLFIEKNKKARNACAIISAFGFVLTIILCFGIREADYQLVPTETETELVSLEGDKELIPSDEWVLSYGGYALKNMVSKDLICRIRGDDGKREIKTIKNGSYQLVITDAHKGHLKREKLYQVFPGIWGYFINFSKRRDLHRDYYTLVIPINLK